jgi:hypothetical protein
MIRYSRFAFGSFSSKGKRLLATLLMMNDDSDDVAMSSKGKASTTPIDGWNKPTNDCQSTSCYHNTNYHSLNLSNANGYSSSSSSSIGNSSSSVMSDSLSFEVTEGSHTTHTLLLHQNKPTNNDSNKDAINHIDMSSGTSDSSASASLLMTMVTYGDGHETKGNNGMSNNDRKLCILSLPDVVTISMMSWLTAMEACTSSRVCHAWHVIALCDGVWRSIVLSNWSNSTANSSRIISSPPTPYHTIVTNHYHSISSLSSLPCWPSSSSSTAASLTLSNGNSGAADWRSRYRELHRIARNWKYGICNESLLIGHTARVNAVSCGADIIVR